MAAAGNIFSRINCFMELAEVIIQRIYNEGPFSFRDFMEMALQANLPG
jgi:SAM-dependent MidA family methyltransferase